MIQVHFATITVSLVDPNVFFMWDGLVVKLVGFTVQKLIFKILKLNRGLNIIQSPIINT